MKLDYKDFCKNGVICYNETTYNILKRYNTIRLKSILKNTTITDAAIDDIVEAAVLVCMDKLLTYDERKNNSLGGYLSYVVLGEYTKWKNKARHSAELNENLYTIPLDQEAPPPETVPDYHCILGTDPARNDEIHARLDEILLQTNLYQRKLMCNRFKKDITSGMYK